MDKGLFIFVTIGLISIYFLTNFVGELQDEDEIKRGVHKKDTQYALYESVDVVGDSILDVHTLDVKKQLEVWNKSELKPKFLALFPNFDEMKRFVNNRVVGEALQNKLLQTIDDVEIQFISGTSNGIESKAKLEALK